MGDPPPTWQWCDEYTVWHDFAPDMQATIRAAHAAGAPTVDIPQASLSKVGRSDSPRVRRTWSYEKG